MFEFGLDRIKQQLSNTRSKQVFFKEIILNRKQNRFIKSRINKAYLEQWLMTTSADSNSVNTIRFLVVAFSCETDRSGIYCQWFLRIFFSFRESKIFKFQIEDQFYIFCNCWASDLFFIDFQLHLKYIIIVQYPSFFHYSRLLEWWIDT